MRLTSHSRTRPILGGYSPSIAAYSSLTRPSFPTAPPPHFDANSHLYNCRVSQQSSSWVLPTGGTASSRVTAYADAFAAGALRQRYDTYLIRHATSFMHNIPGCTPNRGHTASSPPTATHKPCLLMYQKLIASLMQAQLLRAATALCAPPLQLLRSRVVILPYSSSILEQTTLCYSSLRCAARFVYRSGEGFRGPRQYREGPQHH